MSTSLGSADGRRIGRYVVTGRIGRGGMGMVWRGYDPGLDREVAVKTLSLEATLEEEHRRRFEIEARAAAKLQHPNIVTVYELGDDRGVPFIAMELLGGADLEMLLRSGDPLLLQEQLDVMVQVCRGLNYAHERRIVHRDIKPSNIRVLEDGTAKIMDFGIAKLAGSGLTKSGMLVGTVHYMSPEQVLGKPLDGRADLFSVGVILYELLSGRRPFVGESPTEVLYRIVHDATPALPETLGGQTAALQEVVARALAKKPEDRPVTAARLADELAQILGAHLREAPTALLPEVQETVHLSRRLLQEGQVEESMERLRQVTERYPQSLEARRALRWASREVARREARPAGPEEFAELDAKFLSAPTRREPETVLQDTHVQRTPTGGAAGPRRRPELMWGAAALGVALLLAVIAFVRRPSSERPTPVTPSISPTVAPPAALTGSAVPPPAVPEAEVLVSSEPSGAALTLDGRPVPGLTPLTVRLDPRADHRLVVWREGYAPQEFRLAAGRVPPALAATLQRPVAPGTVEVVSSYPLDVLWKGKVLARGQESSQVSLPAGAQVLTLVAPAHFLNANVPVEVRASESVRLGAPALGKLHIRAQPDNCRVFIDGAFVDYPPILDRPVAVGSHTVAFQWPDGARREQAVEVTDRAPAYVTGRKD